MPKKKQAKKTKQKIQMLYFESPALERGEPACIGLYDPGEEVRKRDLDMIRGKKIKKNKKKGKGMNR